MLATNVVREDKLDVDPRILTPGHVSIIKAAAEDPLVERILVNAAIKKALCRDARGDRAWLNKVRPWYWHNYHFHVRIGCPKGSPNCKPQPPAPDGEGCGAELAWWLGDEPWQPSDEPPPPPLRLGDLPAQCRTVLEAP